MSARTASTQRRGWGRCSLVTSWRSMTSLQVNAREVFVKRCCAHLSPLYHLSSNEGILCLRSPLILNFSAFKQTHNHGHLRMLRRAPHLVSLQPFCYLNARTGLLFTPVVFSEPTGGSSVFDNMAQVCTSKSGLLYSRQVLVISPLESKIMLRYFFSSVLLVIHILIRFLDGKENGPVYSVIFNLRYER